MSAHDPKHASVVRALESRGLTIVRDRNQFCALTPEYRITWLIQDDLALCLRVARHHDKDDFQSDYHAGDYASSIKQALRYAQLAS